MKIATAHGKQTVKMSKEEWQSIGKTAGWMKTAQSAPVPQGNEKLVKSTISGIDRLISSLILVKKHLSQSAPKVTDINSVRNILLEGDKMEEGVVDTILQIASQSYSTEDKLYTNNTPV